MPYRRSGETLKVRTVAGGLEIVTSAEGLVITGRLRITRDTATFQTRRGREQHAIRGSEIIVSRNAPQGDVAIWMESGVDGAGSCCMRRIFGVAADPTVSPRALTAG
jgi:hypothetical protein